MLWCNICILTGNQLPLMLQMRRQNAASQRWHRQRCLSPLASPAAALTETHDSSLTCVSTSTRLHAVNTASRAIQPCNGAGWQHALSSKRTTHQVSLQLLGVVELRAEPSFDVLSRCARQTLQLLRSHGGADRLLTVCSRATLVSR